MSYQALKEFERAVAKDQYYGKQTTNYLGTLDNLKKSGQVVRHRQLGPNDLQKTPRTWRVCRGCAGTRFRSHVHYITGQVNLVRCPSCKGEGMVFG